MNDTNCVYCGSHLVGNVCEYCGTVYSDRPMYEDWKIKYPATVVIDGREVKCYVQKIECNAVLDQNCPRIIRTFTLQEI